jgi:hypothetical protein
MFDLFWDFDGLSKAKHKLRGDHAISTPCLGIFGFWAYVIGTGMSSHGFTHV